MSDTATPTATPDAPLLTGAPATPSSTTPPPSQFFGEHVAKEGRFQEGWTEHLRAQGFERLANKAATAGDEATLFRILDETIGFTGKKTIPQYPGADADDATLSAYRKSAGVPDSPEAYNLKPEALPEGVTWDDATAKDIAGILHKHHVPQAAAQELIARHMETVAAQSKAAGETYQQMIQGLVAKSDQTFRQEWGSEYETRLESNRAFIQSRLAPQELADPTLAAALSHPQIVRLVDEARRSLREAPLPGVSAENSGGSLSPRQQAIKIMEANPKWDKDPATAKRVQDLYALEAAQSRRRK
jgi:hypothetical protein